MKGIELYLEKFKNFGFKEKQFKQTILDVLKEYKIELETKDIDVREGVVRLNLSGSAKSELFLNKNNIEMKVLDKMSKDKFIDIK